MRQLSWLPARLEKLPINRVADFSTIVRVPREAVCSFCEKLCTVPSSPGFAYNPPGRGWFRHPPGGTMHWVKLLVEVWILFGVVTVISGLLWTSKLSKESQPSIAKNISPLQRAELSANNLSKVRSA